MAVVPSKTIEALEFCELHWPIWTSAPAAVGLTAANVLAMKNATDAARASYDIAQNARLASKAATTSLGAAISDMRSVTGELINQIRSFAELQSNPALVYSEAQIPAPAAPTPMPVPGKPSNFTIGLEPDGSITLSWDATESAASTGAFFTVSRKLPGQTAFIGIGGASGSTTESRRCFFTDATCPATAASNGAQYIVQGFRGTRSGTPSDAITVQFGTDGGTFLASSNAPSSIKMAA